MKSGVEMKVSVLYHSITGNTKKIAEAIADEVGVYAENITHDSNKFTADVLFLGDGNYVSNIHKVTKELIKSLENKNIKNIAVFGTYGGMNNAKAKMIELIKNNGLNVLDENFFCKGKAWGVLNRNKPGKEDIEGAKDFARHVIRKISKNDL